MKKILILLIVCTSLTACLKNGKQSVQEGNFVIHLLFEKDGCKVYRFMDGGRAIYWSNCEGKISSDYQSGKTTHYDEVITTKPE